MHIKQLTEKIVFDWWIFMGFVSFAVISVVLLYSSGSGQLFYAQKQLIYYLVCLITLFFVAQIPVQQIQKFSPFFYILLVMMLVFVFLKGQGQGAQRWIELGLFNIQPSEFMKVVLPIMLSWWLEKTNNSRNYLAIGLVYLLIVSIPLALIILQPDLGTSIMIGLTAGVIILLVGMPWKYILGLIALCLTVVPFLWVNMHSYQKQRVLTFLDPYTDPLGHGYHTIQSQIAIGSGGLSGKGWLQGTQSQLNFVPEQHTDFIFSLLAEEFGFLGILALFALYTFVLLRGLYIAYQAQETFARVLAASLIISFFLNAVVNMSMVLGLLPIVGLPLPLISYGGSSMLTHSLAFGLIMAISSERLYLLRK